VAFNYDATSIGTDLAKVRLMIGDTVNETADDESLTDEEINYALSESNSLIAAAIMCAEWLMGRLRKKIGRNVGSVSSNQREKIDGLEDLLEVLNAREAKGSELECYAGQVESSRNVSNDDDASFEQPSFKVGGMDNPSTSDWETDD